MCVIFESSFLPTVPLVLLELLLESISINRTVISKIKGS